MREFSKNPNKIDESDEDSDIDISVDIDEVRTVLNPYFDSDTSDNVPSGNEVENSEDDDDDDDFVPETDSDESVIESVIPQTSAVGMRSMPSTSGTAVPNDNVSDDDFEEEDKTVKAIRAAIEKPRTSPPLINIDDFITDLSFHPTDDIIAVGTITGDVLLYKYSNEENTLLKKLEVHTKACRTVEFDDDGKCLLTGSKDKSIMITDIETEKLKQFYDDAHDSSIYKLYVIDENMFSTGDESGTVKLWDKRSEGFIFALKEVEDFISAMLTNEAKKLLLVTSGDGYLTTLNIGSRKLFVQSEPYEEELTCMGLYRGDSKVIIGTSKGRLYSYKWGEFGYHSDMYPGVKSPIDCMLPITDRISCLAGDEGILRATHIAPFKNLGIVGQQSLPIEAMDINNSGEFIASCSDSTVGFWNIKYFEDFTDIKYNVKNNDHRDRQHNLPSSKFANNSDFFADLAN